MATRTPEIKSVANQKNNSNNKSRVKKSLFVEEKEEDPDCENNTEKVILDDSGKDSEFRENFLSLTPDEFEDVERDEKILDGSGRIQNYGKKQFLHRQCYRRQGR